MAVWHHQLDGHEFVYTPGAGDWQRGLACCDSWGQKESDTTEWLNLTELKYLQANSFWFPSTDTWSYWAVLTVKVMILESVEHVSRYRRLMWVINCIGSCGYKFIPPFTFWPLTHLHPLLAVIFLPGVSVHFTFICVLITISMFFSSL